MERSTLRLAGWLLAALLLAAPLSARAAEPSPVTIKVMTFNIWLGGDQVSFQKVIEAIKAADADIVCLQEAGGQTARIAAALGWNYAVPGRHVIARVPLFAPQAASRVRTATTSTPSMRRSSLAASSPSPMSICRRILTDPTRCATISRPPRCWRPSAASA